METAGNGGSKPFIYVGSPPSGMQNNEIQYTLWNGVQNTVVQNASWNGVLSNYPGWIGPLFLVQGAFPYGWWGYWQDWGGGYTWPNCYPPGLYQPMYPTNPVNHTTNLCGGLQGVSSQSKEGQAGRAPISIRKPSLGKGLGPDPVEEDIVNKESRVLNDVGMHFDRFASDEDIRNELGPLGGGTEINLSRPEADQAGQQNPFEEEDDDDGGLRNLFEDPEYPPGFELGPAPPELERDPEEAFVKEEAKQTLILAKKLGCSVLDEERALGNIEGIIREQRSSYRQRCQAAKERSKEESDSCSRNTSDDRTRKVLGTRCLGFSKFSRTSKIARRCRKKAS